MGGDKLIPEKEAQRKRSDAQQAAEQEAAEGAEEILPEQPQRGQQRLAYARSPSMALRTM